MSKTIITISREFGSGGRSIGKSVAEALEIPYYDKELIKQVAEKTGFAPEYVENAGEYAPGKSVLAYFAAFSGRADVMGGMNASDFLWCMQRQVILDLVEKGSCVIVGRCADYILAGRPDVVRVFVHADKDFCLEQAMKVDSLPEQEVEKKIAEIDDYRARYYKHHTGHDWYDARNYDLSLNSGVLGFDGTVEEIIKYMEVREQFQK